MKCLVSVEKRMFATGTIEIDCEDADQAIKLVQDGIDRGVLHTSDVDWHEPQYEDCSFATTGDCD